MSIVYDVRLEMSDKELDYFVKLYADYVANIPFNRYQMTFPEWLTKLINENKEVFVKDLQNGRISPIIEV